MTRLPDMKSLPKLVIFGDPRKEGVSEAIEEFAGFANGKAEIVANCSVADCLSPFSERRRPDRQADDA
jgi:hypothetical protein